MELFLFLCYNYYGEYMRKIFVLLSLFLLVGCTNKIKEGNCKIDLKNSNEGYTLKANYKIYYDKNEYVTRIEEDITYKSDNESVLDFYYKAKSMEYQKLYNYNGIKYSIELIDNKIKITSTRDLKETNVKKMIKDKLIDRDYTSANKLTLYGMKDYYEAKGAVCDIE